MGQRTVRQATFPGIVLIHSFPTHTPSRSLLSTLSDRDIMVWKARVSPIYLYAGLILAEYRTVTAKRARVLYMQRLTKRRVPRIIVY